MSEKKILIVDDEPTLLKLLQIHLQKEGYEVLTAESVDEALQALESGPVDLVLLDIRMPEKDGFNFLSAVSDPYGVPRMPVILMTARSEFESLMGEIAVDGFINKPFEMASVLEKVKQVLLKKPKRVYLADIEGHGLAQAIAKELRAERFQVIFINDVSSFKASFAEQPPDYVVMAYEQHSIEGKDMISLIRSCTDVPLIVYTCSEMDFREKSLASGASIYIKNPKTPAPILTAIHKFEIK
ncbi:MAG: response regulator [Candidatus Omnitrophota bacterium]